jgi:hypothetical protein
MMNETLPTHLETLLRTLIDLVNWEVDALSTEALYSNIPESNQILADLDTLDKLGYINCIYADNKLDHIGIGQRAIEYFGK